MSTSKYALTKNENHRYDYICDCLTEFYNADDRNMDDVGNVFCSPSCAYKYGVWAEWEPRDEPEKAETVILIDKKNEPVYRMQPYCRKHKSEILAEAWAELDEDE